MHIVTLKKLSLTLIIALTLRVSVLRAQTFTAPLQVTTSGANPVDFEFRADGTMIAKGNPGVGTLLSTDQGESVRMLWFPALGAFRAGVPYSNGWDLENLGEYSIATGCFTTASGHGSAAFGSSSTASGYCSMAFGEGSYAGGMFSTAFGRHSSASGYGSTASGYFTTASGYLAVSSGSRTTAFGYSSTASGYNTLASGYVAASSGRNTTASGDYSSAAGCNTKAASFASFVIGLGPIRIMGVH